MSYCGCPKQNWFNRYQKRLDWRDGSQWKFFILGNLAVAYCDEKILIRVIPVWWNRS